MDEVARPLLCKLLKSGEMSHAGRRSRQAAITEAQLSEYRNFTSLRKKESFEETVKAAQADGAIDIQWDSRHLGDGFIRRINLADVRKLAAFLGIRLEQDKVAESKALLETYIQKYPVLQDLIEHWSSLKKVRGLGPETSQEWLDAIKTIEACRDSSSQDISMPVREFSSQLFKDSKRIERLIVPIDVLLAGSMDNEARSESGVLQELGLFREEHPVRMAGNIMVERERFTGYLDRPYTGLPANTILGLASKPELVMTIENLTTFHSEAKRRCDENVLLIYTAGMPSPSWRAMYKRLLEFLPKDVPVYHWGDVDEGGFRIAAALAADAKSTGHTLLPWRMHPSDVPEHVRRKALPHTISRIRHFSAAAGWNELGNEVAEAGFTVEQESLAAA